MPEDLAPQLRAARAAWPDLRVSERVFLEYLEKKGLTVAATAPTASTRLADLYLACACQYGARGALAAFEAHTRRDVDAALAHARLGSASADDVRELVRQKLFVPAPGRTAKISEYSGKGSLRGWVRAIAARTAIDVARARRGDVAMDDVLERALPQPGADVELDNFKRRHAKDFKSAFQDAVKALSASDQLLLRQYYLDGLDTRQLAALYRVHTGTVVRWLGQLRTELGERTQQLLRRRLKLNASEFRSFARLVQSQVDVSIRRVLGGRATTGSHRPPPEGDAS